MIMLDARRDTPNADDGDAMPEPVAAPPRPVAIAKPAPTATPARAVAAKPVASGAQPTTVKASGSRAAKVAPLPRGKAAFEEEDLPF
jgi:hypothetical protein